MILMVGCTIMPVKRLEEQTHLSGIYKLTQHGCFLFLHTIFAKVKRGKLFLKRRVDQKI